MRGRCLGSFSALFCAGLLSLFAGSASAGSFDLGAAAGYAGLGLDGVPITIAGGNTVINGNIGVGPNGSLDFSAGGKILGRIDQDPAASVSITGGSTASGGVNPMSMTPAVNDALAAAASAAALSPTQTIASITNANSTITGNGGSNVVNVTGDVNLSGGTLTFNGTPNDQFVVNIGGAMTLSNGSKIVLNGGVTPNHVLFNLTGAGKNVLVTNSDSFGIFLDPNGSIFVSGGAHQSSFIAGTSLTFDGSESPLHITAIAAAPVPAPFVASLGLLGLVALVQLTRHRNKSAVLV